VNWARLASILLRHMYSVRGMTLTCLICKATFKVEDADPRMARLAMLRIAYRHLRIAHRDLAQRLEKCESEVDVKYILNEFMSSKSPHPSLTCRFGDIVQMPPALAEKLSRMFLF